MAYISEHEAANLTIRKMILHIVGGGRAFKAEAEFPQIEFEDFFIERIQATNAAGLFAFEQNSRVKACLERMAHGQLTFESGAQELSELFNSYHQGQSRNGALFMFELDVGDPAVHLYSLIKFDYRDVIERTGNLSGGQALRKIVEAFVDDPRALQKSCLVRIAGGVASGDISAIDRIGKAPDLTDYFSRFLGVARARSDEELSKATSDALRAALSAVRSLLPNQNVPAALAAAKDNLSNRQAINDAAIHDAAMIAAGNPQVPETRAEIERAVNIGLRQHKVAGLTFAPVRAVLSRPHKKRVQTAEGVTIEYPYNLENTRVRTVTDASGTTITIQTQRIESETVVRERGR